jgi:hypothetical protein
MYLKYSIKVPNDIVIEIGDHLASQQIYPANIKSGELEIVIIKTNNAPVDITNYINKIKNGYIKSLAKDRAKVGFKFSKFYVDDNNDLILELKCDPNSLLLLDYFNLLCDYFKIDNRVSISKPHINLGRVDKSVKKADIKYKDKIFYLNYTN